MTAAEEWFVDTNVLVYATNARSPWRRDAEALLSLARQRGIELVISTQVVREYLAVTTRPEAGKIDKSTVRDALDNVRTFQSELRVIPEDSAVSERFVELVEQYEVGGKQVHDANIVACMLIHGVRSLLTFNAHDFKRFADLITILPISSTEHHESTPDLDSIEAEESEGELPSRN
jgi:predicted nucleic acid-binding protein